MPAYNSMLSITHEKLPFSIGYRIKKGGQETIKDGRPIQADVFHIEDDCRLGYHQLILPEKPFFASGNGDGKKELTIETRDGEKHYRIDAENRELLVAVLTSGKPVSKKRYERAMTAALRNGDPNFRYNSGF